MRSGAALKQLNKWADVSCQLDSKKFDLVSKVRVCIKLTLTYYIFHKKSKDKEVKYKHYDISHTKQFVMFPSQSN